MKTKTILSTRLSLLLPTLTFLTIGGTFGACTPKFEDECPPGTVQKGGGDVKDPNVCQPIGGSGGAPGSGGSGGAPQAGGGGSGSGGGTGGTAGSGGGSGGVCAPNATKCEGDAQQTCDAQGQWGAAVACEIACNGDGEGKACVVPVQLAAGSAHVCALLSDGTARCWGSDSNGQLGNGPTAADSARPVAVVGLAGATALDVDGNFSCARRADKTMACWGKHFLAGTSVVQQAPVDLDGAQSVEDAGVTESSVCVLKDGGALQCKGQNGQGQLGTGGTAASSTFSSTSGFPSQPVEVSGHSGAYCAALSDGTVACWGYGLYGQNASTSQQNLLNPTLVPGNVRSIQHVVVGEQATCAVRDDKNLLCWGGNGLGQLGRDSISTSPQAPGFVPGFGTVERVAVGRQHVCAVKSDKTVWCWGGNDSGQLGNKCEAIGCSQTTEGQTYVASPAKVPLGNVTSVAAALDHTCALAGDGKVYCWGENGLGQLGNGSVGGSVPVPTPVVWKLGPLRAARHRGPA